MWTAAIILGVCRNAEKKIFLLGPSIRHIGAIGSM
jgi:hypothetical protein